MTHALQFIKKNTVPVIAVLAAAATTFLVPPDRQYLSYFDWKTLSCLFMTLAVVCALRNIKFFTITARQLVRFAGNLRMLAVMLLLITFIGSMLIANDMALITFLPIGYYALHVTDNEKYAAYLFILQNIAANLGGMLTPFGNPQNLYLYTAFHIPTGEFTKIMFPPFVVAVSMLMLCCLPLKRKKLLITDRYPLQLDKKKTVVYLILFALSVCIVFRLLPFQAGLLVITAVLLVLDRRALKAVDYPLLLTFLMFFIFAGNMARIDAVRDFLSQLLEKSPLLISILSCQCISNVPTAILLSRFTTDYRSLLLGVNIGGTGTLIASLASLITFSQYRSLYPGKTKKYLLTFAGLNILFLSVLTLFAYFFG